MPVLVFLITLFLNNPLEDQLPEQIAIDYFFNNILAQEFPEFKSIEFNERTQSLPFGIMNGCKDYAIDLSFEEVHNIKPNPTTFILDAQKCPIKVKRQRKNSHGLKVSVSSRINIKDRVIVQIIVYRKLRFSQHFFISIDPKNLEITSVCKVSEII